MCRFRSNIAQASTTALAEETQAAGRILMNRSTMLMTLAGGIAACWFVTGCATEWDRTSRVNTREAYTVFMDKHPDDPHRNQAETALKRLDEFDRARALDNATEYATFLQSYTTNNVEGGMVAGRLKELQDPITVPSSLKDEAARSFASGNKYYIWADPESTNTVSLAGSPNAVFMMAIRFYAIGAPGSDCPVFRPAFSFVRWNDAKTSLEGTWSWMESLGKHFGLGFAGPACATKATALWWNTGGTLSGRGPVAVVLLDDKALNKKGQDIAPISNAIMVPVDCSKVK